MSDLSDLTTNIHRLSTVLGRVADRTLQDAYGIGMSQFKILWVLNKHQEGVLQINIASWMSQTEAAISRQVKLLADDGLIHKTVDPKNRRNHIIQLSVEGKRFADEAMDLLVKNHKPYFAFLSSDEKKALNAILEKIFLNACKTIGE
jgi:DNA-binding MarR family transcriptional regulator